MRTGIDITFTEAMEILGYVNYDKNFWPINFILINVRHYIYSCSKTKQVLNIFQVQKKVKITYEEEHMLSKINSQIHVFNKRWSTWHNLFLNI